MKRALLVGINYKGTNNELSGCTDDVRRMIPTLLQNGYTNDNILLLADDTGEISPTSSNILKGIKWLSGTTKSGEFSKSSITDGPNENITNGAPQEVTFQHLQFSSGRKYYFHYSGHGTFCTKCHNLPLGVSRADAICPVDFSTSGLIYDNILRGLLVDKLNKNDSLLAILDCCYSGTELDLSWAFDEKNKDVVKVNNYLPSNGFVCSLSGCTDYETSEVVKVGDKFEGALSYAFLKAYSKGNQTYQSLISNIRDIISGENLSSQTPNLHFGYQIDPEMMFTL